MIELYIVYPNGTRSENNLANEFGKYYDTLTRIMDTEQYHFTQNSTTTFYGLIAINNFANCIDARPLQQENTPATNVAGVSANDNLNS